MPGFSRRIGPARGELRPGCSRKRRRKRNAAGYCRTIISPWTGRCCRPWASFKSFTARDGKVDQMPPDDLGNPTVDFHGEKRSNATHQSTTDPDARLYKKGKGRSAQLAYLGHRLMENRHGLVVDTELTPADSYGERDAAFRMVERLSPVSTGRDWRRQGVRPCAK